MKKSHKIGRFLGIVLVVLVLLLVGAVIGFKIYTSHYYATDMEVSDQITNEYADKVEVFSNNDGTAFFPKNQEYRAIIVFYPGGKVEYTAYSSLMYKLSSRGYICLLTRMPENIAILRVNKVEGLVPEDEVVKKLANEMDWYMAGHSLGGAAASKYLSDAFSGSAEASEEAAEPLNDDLAKFKGLILCGAYPANDLSQAPIRLLSIYGSNDGVMNRESYEEYRANWPADSTEEIIEGGNHSYFGTYGLQEGDGEATISNEEQLEITAELIDEWISKAGK